MIVSVLPLNVLALSSQEQQDIYRVGTDWRQSMTWNDVQWLLNSNNFVYHQDIAQGNTITKIKYSALNLSDKERKDNFKTILTSLIGLSYEATQKECQTEILIETTESFLDGLKSFISDGKKYTISQQKDLHKAIVEVQKDYLNVNYGLDIKEYAKKFGTDHLKQSIANCLEGKEKTLALEAVDNYVQSDSWLKKMKNSSDFFKDICTYLDIATDGFALYSELESYQKADEKLVQLLEYINNNTNDIALRYVCQEIKNNFARSYGENLAVGATKLIAKQVYKMAIDGAKELISDTLGIYAIFAKMGIEGGKIVSNSLFNTGDTIKFTQTMYCLNIISEILVPRINREIALFDANRSNDSAAAKYAADIIYHMQVLLELRLKGEEAYYKMKDSSYSSDFITMLITLGASGLENDKTVIENWYRGRKNDLLYVKNELFRKIPYEFYAMIESNDINVSQSNVKPYLGNLIPDLSTAGYKSTINPLTKAGYGGQCTAFVYGRVYEKLGIKLSQKSYKATGNDGLTKGTVYAGFTGNARTWWYVNQQLCLYPYGSTPAANSIVIWDDGNTGHVAFVEEVTGSKVKINEANWNKFKNTKYGGGYDGDVKTLSTSAMKKRGDFKLLGYIYLDSSKYVAPAISSVSNSIVTNKTATIKIGLNQTAKVKTWTYYISTKESALKGVNGCINSTYQNPPANVYRKRVKDVSNNPKSIKSDTIKIELYNDKELKPNTTYYYFVVAKIGDAFYQSSVKSFKTTNKLPDSANLRISRDSMITGIGDSVSLLWDATSNTDTYTIQIKNESGELVQEKTKIKGSTFSMDPLTESGIYTATIYSVNEVGTKEGTSAEFTVEPNRLVRFYDTVSDEVIYEESVPYGHNANAPKAPAHYGHTFSQWSRSFENVKDAGEGEEHIITVNTVYDLNTYTVRFIDGFTNEILSTQSIKYKKAAVAPVSLPEHKGFEFVSWDKEYSVIEQDTDIYTVYQWEDPDHLAVLTIDSVTRTIPKENSEENVGYDVSVTISNSADRIISGRIVAVLKSAEGTILSQAESAAFAVDKAPKNEAGNIVGTTDRQVTFTVLYDDFAPQIELYLINDYDKLGQLASMVSTDIDNSGIWSGLIRFEGDEPPIQSDAEKGITAAVEGPFNETVKYYRYRILEKSYDTSAPTAGYTQAGYTKVNGQQKSVDYVASWPSGFLKTNSLYTKYNNQPATASETATQITEVSSPTTKGYIYYHWCMGTYTNGPINRGINGSKTSTYKQFHAFYTTSAVSFDSSAKAYKKSVSGTCKDTYWWYGLTPDKSGNIIVKTQNYTVYDKLYNYYSDYSEWIPYVGECPLTNGALVDGNVNKTYEVETKSETNEYYCYKYCMNNTPEEPVIPDDDPRVVRVSGTISSDYAAKTATVWIYKYTQASDYTTEYVGNTVVGSNGQIYINRAILREAPSVQSGDYTIVVSVPGQEQALQIGTIKAPKAKYTVVFEDYSGNVISSQEIMEGDSAVVPDSALAGAPEGYRFVRWSESVVNVKGNLTVKPEFEKKKFVIAFVDWNEQSVVLNENVEYGSELISVAPPAEIEGYDTEWVVQIGDQYLTIEEYTNSGYTVTGNMVVTTRNSPKDYSVIFLNADSEVILENKLQTIDNEKLTVVGLSENTESLEIAADITVTYGIGIDYSDVIDLEEKSEYVFMGWINAATGEALESVDVTESVVLYPRYIFAETTETPIASFESGEYYEELEVELAVDSNDVSIWYTLDGTDPTVSNTVMEYTGPISIGQPCILRYYATALGYNDSNEDYRVFAINLNEDDIFHVVTVYAMSEGNLPIDGEPSIGLVHDGAVLPNSLFNDSFKGFVFEGIYKDKFCTENLNIEEERIFDSVTLFAHYNREYFTVNFHAFDGSVHSTQEVPFGSSAISPDAPEVDDYIFVGWDGDYSYVDGDLEVFARYITPDEYATISLDKKAVTLNVGASYANLQTIITPALHSDYNIEWYSSNEDIASVDENGVITALSVGTTTITAKLPYTGETAEVIVKVAYDLDREIVLLQGSSIGFDSNHNLRVTPSVDHTANGILAAFENANLSICKADGTELTGTDIVGTGCVVKLVSGDELIDFATVVLTGDFNGDGAINNKDVVMLNQLVLEKREADLWQMIALDVNGDGYVNNKDCAMLARYLVGKESL